MMYYGAYPATLASGFGKTLPVAGKAVSPWGYGKPFGFFGKPFAGFGYPATKASGYSAAVPVTSVATTPFPGVI